MEKRRKNTKVILILLLLAVVGLSIGFAAYGSTLKIQSNAEYTANPTNFKVVFSSSDEESAGGTTVVEGVATAATITKDSTTITGLTANFTAPGQTAVWKLNAYNDGEYEAFLKNVTIGEITCTPKTGTTASLVEKAKAGLSVKVSVGGTEYTATTEGITKHSLPKTEGEEVVVTLAYAAGSEIADGDFSVTIGDIVLEYKSVD